MAAKKSSARKKPATRRKAAKSARKKPANRKPAARKATGRKPAAKTASGRRRRVATAVKTTAERGIAAAKVGLGRIKSATTHLVGAARDRLAGDDSEP